MQSMPFRFGPVSMSATLTTNILNPGTTTGGTASTAAPFDKLWIILTHIHVANKTAGAVSFSLWIGATGANSAGTEWFNAYSVAAQSVYDWYGRVRISQADFLVGGASAGTSLVIQGEGEIGVGA